MREFIRHFLRSRKTCNGFCPTCEHYEKCKEDLNNERNMG